MLPVIISFFFSEKTNRMNTAKNLGIITVFLAFLVHLNHARNIQMDCLTLCAEGIDSLSCDCYNNDPFRYVKRGLIKLPFRYGKRSSMGYPANAQYLRNGFRYVLELIYLSFVMATVLWDILQIPNI